MASKLSYFFDNISLHGFKYLNVANEPSWKRVFARVFWTSCIAISITLMCSILSTTINEFGSISTSINLDTNYRDWNNTFPAISICMTKGRSTDKIRDYMVNYWESNNLPVLPRAIRYYRGIQSLMFLNHHQPLDGVKLDLCLEFNNTCGVDMDILKRDLLPRDCSEFMVAVLWQTREIPCNKIFKLHETEIGQCFIANSLYSDIKSLTEFRYLPLKYSNLDILERSFAIKYIDLEFVEYKLFIHSPEELPDGNLADYRLRKAGSFNYIAIKPTEIRNQQEVLPESVETRQCRFPSEILQEFNLPYSLSNCHANERMKREISKCNCTLPIGNIPKGFEVCNVTRYQCTLDSIIAQKKAASEETNPCATPSCLAMEIVNIGQVEKDYVSGLGLLKIEVLNKPSLQYIRRVSVSKLDLIGEEEMLFTNDIIEFTN
jgi:hypothetical protein